MPVTQRKGKIVSPSAPKRALWKQLVTGESRYSLKGLGQLDCSLEQNRGMVVHRGGSTPAIFGLAGSCGLTGYLKWKRPDSSDLPYPPKKKYKKPGQPGQPGQPAFTAYLRPGEHYKVGPQMETKRLATKIKDMLVLLRSNLCQESQDAMCYGGRNKYNTISFSMPYEDVKQQESDRQTWEGVTFGNEDDEGAENATDDDDDDDGDEATPRETPQEIQARMQRDGYLNCYDARFTKDIESFDDLIDKARAKGQIPSSEITENSFVLVLFSIQTYIPTNSEMASAKLLLKELYWLHKMPSSDKMSQASSALKRTASTELGQSVQRPQVSPTPMRTASAGSPSLTSHSTPATPESSQLSTIGLLTPESSPSAARKRTREAAAGTRPAKDKSTKRPKSNAAAVVFDDADDIEV